MVLSAFYPKICDIEKKFVTSLNEFLKRASKGQTRAHEYRLSCSVVEN